MVSKFFVLTTSITKCHKTKIYYKVWQRKFHEFQNSDYEVWEKAITKCGKY